MARANQPTWAVLNAGLATAYGNAGVTVADVAATFRIDDFTDTVFFGDPHANRTGYRKIARTFDRELQGLLP